MSKEEDRAELNRIQAQSDAILTAIRDRITLITGNADPIPVFLVVGDRRLTGAIMITNIDPPAQAMRVLVPLINILPTMKVKRKEGAASLIVMPPGSLPQ